MLEMKPTSVVELFNDVIYIMAIGREVGYVGWSGNCLAAFVFYFFW